MQSPKVTTCNFDKSLIIILYIERRIFALSSALLSSCNLYFMIQWDNSVNYVSKFKCFIQCRKSYWYINPCKKFFPTAKFKINLGALTLLLKMTTNKSDSFLLMHRHFGKKKVIFKGLLSPNLLRDPSEQLQNNCNHYESFTFEKFKLTYGMK